LLAGLVARLLYYVDKLVRARMSVVMW